MGKAASAFACANSEEVLFRSVESYLPSLKLRLIQSSNLGKNLHASTSNIWRNEPLQQTAQRRDDNSISLHLCTIPSCQFRSLSAGTVFTYTSEGRINTVVRCWFPFSSRLIPSHSGWQICESPMNSKFERSRKSRRTLCFHEMFPTNFA
jgi:hypothetical protein